MMTDTLAILSAGCGVLFFFRRRSLRYLRYFQQEEYDWRRFIAWYRRHFAIDRRGTVTCLLAFLGTLLVNRTDPTASVVVSFGGAVALAALPRWEEDPRTTGKIPLRITERAHRIWNVATLLVATLAVLAMVPFLLVGSIGLAPMYWLFLPVFIQSTPFMLLVANQLLSRYENSIQHRFLDEARSILARVNPTVIGITGSYGKTSTKGILGVFLETCGPTFCPPQSINTQMGIVRQIRENLRPGHRFAVIEMGAYGIGSIQKLCALTPPQVAVITSIGMMHLERFGSLDAVYKAKSELAQAVPPEGVLVCNGDNPGARRIAVEFRKARTILYGFDPSCGPLDCCMSNLMTSSQGTNFSIHWEGQVYQGSTQLLGRPLLSNLLGAFATACALGAHPVALIAEARNLRPQPHRLELRSNAGVVSIDDTYNSNPVGFAEALAILEAQPGQRKILVTPGMVELGELQESENERLANLAASVCDLILVVGNTNRTAFAKGLRTGGAGEDRTKFFAHRESARAHLNAHLREGDVVLWENDLPDVYEDSPKF